MAIIQGPKKAIKLAELEGRVSSCCGAGLDIFRLAGYDYPICLACGGACGAVVKGLDAPARHKAILEPMAKK
jgi:hypothetical protein